MLAASALDSLVEFCDEASEFELPAEDLDDSPDDRLEAAESAEELPEAADESTEPAEEFPEVSEELPDPADELPLSELAFAAKPCALLAPGPRPPAVTQPAPSTADTTSKLFLALEPQ